MLTVTILDNNSHCANSLQQCSLCQFGGCCRRCVHVWPDVSHDLGGNGPAALLAQRCPPAHQGGAGGHRLATTPVGGEGVAEGQVGQAQQLQVVGQPSSWQSIYKIEFKSFGHLFTACWGCAVPGLNPETLTAKPWTQARLPLKLCLNTSQDSNIHIVTVHRGPKNMLTNLRSHLADQEVSREDPLFSATKRGTGPRIKTTNPCNIFQYVNFYSWMKKKKKKFCLSCINWRPHFSPSTLEWSPIQLLIMHAQVA